MGNLIKKIKERMKYTSMVSAAAAAFGFGECPDVNWISNADFNAAAYAGEWYEWKRHTDFTFEMNQVCTTMEFKLENGSTNKMDLYYRSNAMFNYMGVNGKIDCSQSTTGGTCDVKMADNPDDYQWIVLGTDYASWSVKYYCMEMMGGHMTW